MARGGTQQSLRKYLGALKDSTTVGLAKVNSEYKELDIAIVRATNHVERPAKEKHIKAIFLAVSAARPRADVAYCIHALVRRLSKTRNWADDSSAHAWDYSAWVRTYALYLEERLDCFHVLKSDVETDPLRTRDLETAELLVRLLALQQLLFRLINCQPQGAAVYNFVIQLALSMVAAESKNIYKAISDGMINVVDKFFEMQRHDALKALDIYRRAGQQAERLSEFYEVCKSIDIGRGENIIKIEQPPESFFTAMKEYVREAPRASTVRKVEEKASPKVILAIEDKKASHEQDAPPPPEPIKVEAAPEVVFEEPNLLGLHDNTNPHASELDAKNALALSIVPIDNPSTTSFNDTPAAAIKLAGGLDKLTLDSLYDDAIRRTNLQTSYYNPWEPTPMDVTMMQQPVMAYDPFYASIAVSAPRSVPMAAMAQQQQSFWLQQQQHPLSLNPLTNPYATIKPQPYGLVMPLQSSNTYTSLI